MSMLVELFLLFVVIGAVSFGGGYAMIPVIEEEVTNRGWFTSAEFTDMIAVAGMSPGPIATNSATVVGYHMAGIPGAIISATAMTLPSLVIILVMASFFQRFNHHPFVHAAFYGLRPIITSLIIYAAINFALANELISLQPSWDMLLYAFLFAAALFALLYYRIHPLYVIIGAGLFGILLF